MKSSSAYSNGKNYSKVLAILTIFLSLSNQVHSFSKHHHHAIINSPTSTANTVGLGRRLDQHLHHDQTIPMKTKRTTHPSFHSTSHSQSNQSITTMTTALSLSGGTSTESSYSSSPSRPSNTLNTISKLIQKNSFLLGMALAVSFARIYPSLGVNGGILKPELFIGKFGVTCIFLLSGISLELSELKEAITNVKLNAIVQAGSFLAWPFLIGVPLVSTIKTLLPNLLPKPLLDGLIILTCLPTTVNMAVLLTGRAGGNVASALANAVFGNLFGIFITPALLMYFFGTMIELPFLQMVIKLCNKVLLPVAVGQVLRLTPAKEFFMKNKKRFKSLQEMILIGLVWNAFCNAFTKGIGIAVSHGFILLFMLSSLHIGSLLILEKIFSSKVLNLSRDDVIAATFTTSHKTLAAGLPLVNTIFEGNPNLAAYCAPIMFIHPLQLLIGSLFAEKFVSKDKED